MELMDSLHELMTVWFIVWVVGRLIGAWNNAARYSDLTKDLERLVNK